MWHQPVINELPVTFILSDQEEDLPDFDSVTRKIDFTDVSKDFFHRLFEGQWHKNYLQQDYSVPTNLLEWCLPLAEAVPDDDRLLVRIRFLQEAAAETPQLDVHFWPAFSPF